MKSMILALLLAVPVSAETSTPASLTVYLDFVVEDAKGNPARNLAADEVVVMQEGVREKIATFEAREPAGRYELSYVPSSGKAEAVTLRVLRAAAKVRGATGPALTPRVVAAASPLETELIRLLESRGDANDFALRIRAFRFGKRSTGVQHSLAVEIPLEALPHVTHDSESVAHVQFLVNLKDSGGRVLNRFNVDRSVSSKAESLASQRLVWTTNVKLPTGPYSLDVVARDAAGTVASVRHLSFDSPETTAPGVRMSSVVLLQPAGGLVVRSEESDADDPFVLDGVPLVPALIWKAPLAKLAFFVFVYPDPAQKEPPTLNLKLMKDGGAIGSVAAVLQPPDERGEIRYAAEVPVGSLAAGDYSLRLEAAQGTTTAAEAASFTFFRETGALRPASRPRSETRLKEHPTSPERHDLAEARALLRAKRTADAISRLKKLDLAAGGKDAEVRLALGIAYLQERAYKDAEPIARELVAKDDPEFVGAANLLLGRILADSEKAKISKDSESLRAARDCFLKVRGQSSDLSEPAELALAETLYRLERAEDARAGLQALLARPNVSDATADRARLLLSSPRCATQPCLPSIAFVSPEGRHQTSEDLRGKVVLLSFWATWCRPCLAAVPELKRLYAQHAKEPFIMVGINWDRDRSIMDDFVAKNGISWPQIAEEDARLDMALGVRGIPADLVFDGEGVFVGHTVGWSSSTRSELEGYLHTALKRLKPANP